MSFLYFRFASCAALVFSFTLVRPAKIDAQPSIAISQSCKVLFMRRERELEVDQTWYSRSPFEDLEARRPIDEDVQALACGDFGGACLRHSVTSAADGYRVILASHQTGVSLFECG